LACSDDELVKVAEGRMEAEGLEGEGLEVKG